MGISDIGKVIYIGYAPITAKTANDFFITDLINEEVNVEYWDLSAYYFNELTINNSLAEPWIRKIGNLTELKKLLATNNKANTTYFINFPFSGHTLKLFRLLTRAKVTLCIIARGMIPVPQSTIKKNVVKLFKAGAFLKLYNFGLNKLALLAKKSGFVKPFDRIYFAGEEALKIAGVGYEIDRASAKLIPINSSDYDSFLLASAAGRMVDYKYIVFLDEYLPYHPDAKMFNLKTVEPDEYYRELNSFFDYVEDKFNLKVIIAAHPKAELYYTNNLFGNREIIFYKTAELIKEAECVVMHRSTAVSLAVLFKKKIVFMYTDYMKQKMDYYYTGVKYIADSIGAQAVNISQPILNDLFNFNINDELYNEFKYGFLTSEDIEGISAKEIFIKSIKK